MSEDLMDFIAVIRALYSVTEDKKVALTYVFEMINAMENDVNLTPLEWLDQQGSLHSVLH